MNCSFHQVVSKHGTRREGFFTTLSAASGGLVVGHLMQVSGDQRQ
jgi:hypothetical protein